VDTYDWVPNQPGVLEVWGPVHGLSRPSRFLGWLAGDPVFLIVGWDEAQSEDEAEALDRVFQAGGVLRVSFAGQHLPPSEGRLTFLRNLPRQLARPRSVNEALSLLEVWESLNDSDLVVWVQSDLRWGSMLDEVLS
jgi:hypothetical protein